VSRRFLFTLWPFTGHLLPQIAIALALRERGHEVAFYSGPAVRGIVEEHGFAFYPFATLDEQRGFATMRAVDTGDRRSRPGGGRMLRLLRHWLVETIPAQITDLRAVLADWQPSAIATDLSLWGPIAVLPELDPTPVALSSTFMGPLIPGPDAPAFGFGLRPPRTALDRAVASAITFVTEAAGRPLRRRLDEIRACFGLPPLPESINRLTGRMPLYLVGNIRELDYGRHDLPASVHYVGNCIWYPERESTERWLAQIPTARPWVAVAESTLASGDPFLLRTAIDALAGHPVELIVTTGTANGGGGLGPFATASNVHCAPWLSHGVLLARCAALITVGGKATLLAAMEAGVPTIVVPTTWDKPDNARRITEAGAGIRLSARRLTPERLRQATGEVLNQSHYRAGAERAAARLRAAPGPVRAAELLEQLAARHDSRPRRRAVHGGAT
jgi:UDP:flavonoid glycosyltransferase YjiC (YdhE family)